MGDVKAITGKRVSVQIGALHVRFIPWVTPRHLWVEPFSKQFSMGIPTSPHVALYRLYAAGCGWEQMRGTRYVRERQMRRDMGQPKWTDKYIRDHHLPIRFGIFDSIKKHGFSNKHPIEILEEPFWKTRFNFPVEDEGVEIWTGAGRASAAYVLGMTNIPAVWYRDKKPGSMDRGKFGKKLAHATETWEATFHDK